MDKEILAKWLHDNYEEIAWEKDWDTQESCKVDFNELPEENKAVMIAMAERLLDFDLLRLHYVSLDEQSEAAVCDCGNIVNEHWTDYCSFKCWGKKHL